MVDSAQPFAMALLSIAQENGTEEVTLSWLGNLHQVLIDNPELNTVLKHPGVEDSVKENLLMQIFDGENKTMQDFIKILCRHHAARYLEDVYGDYVRLLDEARNILTVEVTSVVALDDMQQKKLQEALKKRLNADVRLKLDIDPSLIGGLKIKTDNLMMDASLQGRLNKMKEQLQKS